MKSIINNELLAKQGRQRQYWFEKNMPILTKIKTRFKETKPFKDMTIAICMHVEPKTAYWIKGLLQSDVKHIYLVGCVGTTKPDTAAYLASIPEVTVLAKKEDSFEDHFEYCGMVLENKCDILLDNGGSLIRTYHKENRDYTPIGANEETRSGRLLIEQDGIELEFPVIVIDDSDIKRLLENAIGVGQSVVDGFMRATSLLVGGKNILIIGYGYCGFGVARMFKGLGANTFVYDQNPLYQLKAKSEGHIAKPLEDMLPEMDVVVTVTGSFDVLTKKEFSLLKDNCIIANSGHFGKEINLNDLDEMSTNKIKVSENITSYLTKGKEIHLLANAAPVNLVAGDGNPIEIMDLGLGLQSLSAVALLERNLTSEMHNIPSDITEEVAKLSLK